MNLRVGRLNISWLDSLDLRLKLVRRDKMNQENNLNLAKDAKDLVVVISSNVLGGDSIELGKVLMKSFLSSLEQLENPPKTIMFLNAGVRLTTEGSNVIETLKSLELKGTTIYSCGTCLDFFQLKEKLQVGEISNMLTTTKEMISAGSIIKF